MCSVTMTSSDDAVRTAAAARGDSFCSSTTGTHAGRVPRGLRRPACEGVGVGPLLRGGHAGVASAKQRRRQRRRRRHDAVVGIVQSPPRRQRHLARAQCLHQGCWERCKGVWCLSFFARMLPLRRRRVGVDWKGAPPLGFGVSRLDGAAPPDVWSTKWLGIQALTQHPIDFFWVSAVGRTPELSLVTCVRKIVPGSCSCPGHMHFAPRLPWRETTPPPSRARRRRLSRRRRPASAAQAAQSKRCRLPESRRAWREPARRPNFSDCPVCCFKRHCRQHFQPEHPDEWAGIPS